MNIPLTLVTIAVILTSWVAFENNAGAVAGNLNRKHIELPLLGGGSVVMNCPLFITPPMSAHGRECYLMEIKQ